MAAHNISLKRTKTNDVKTIGEKGEKFIFKCYQCNKLGHRASECQNKIKGKYCGFCKREGHGDSECFRKNRVVNANAGICHKEHEETNGVVPIACCLNNSEPEEIKDIGKCIINEKLKLANGTEVDVITNSCITNKNNLPVSQGKIGDHVVNTLRDTGCSGVIVKKKFVKNSEFTGKDGVMLLMDKTLRKAPFARIKVDTPFYTGEVDALCLDDAVFDLIIGNIPGAKLKICSDKIY